MKLSHKLLRLGLAAALISALGACAVAPYPVAYRGAPPGYVQPGATVYYDSGYRYYDGRGGRYYDDRGSRYYDDRRYEDNRRESVPLPPPLELHRDIRRSLGLPRLPGMP